MCRFAMWYSMSDDQALAATGKPSNGGTPRGHKNTISTSYHRTKSSYDESYFIDA